MPTAEKDALADEPCPFCGQRTLWRLDRWPNIVECVNPECPENVIPPGLGKADA